MHRCRKPPHNGVFISIFVKLMHQCCCNKRTYPRCLLDSSQFYKYWSCVKLLICTFKIKFSVFLYLCKIHVMPKVSIQMLSKFCSKIATQLNIRSNLPAFSKWLRVMKQSKLKLIKYHI